MSERVIACADCGKELRSTYEQLYHCCPQRRAANKRAQRKQQRTDSHGHSEDCNGCDWCLPARD